MNPKSQRTRTFKLVAEDGRRLYVTAQLKSAGGPPCFRVTSQKGAGRKGASRGEILSAFPGLAPVLAMENHDEEGVPISPYSSQVLLAKAAAQTTGEEEATKFIEMTKARWRETANEALAVISGWSGVSRELKAALAAHGRAGRLAARSAAGTGSPRRLRRDGGRPPPAVGRGRSVCVRIPGQPPSPGLATAPSGVCLTRGDECNFGTNGGRTSVNRS